MASTEKVQFSLNIDSSVLKKNDFFLVEVKAKTLLEFGLNTQTELKVGIGEVLDREADELFDIKVKLAEVDLLRSLNELDFLDNNLRAFEGDHYGLLFRVGNSEFIKLVLMALLTLDMTDHTHLGHARSEGEFAVGLNVVMLLVRIDDFI